MDCGCGVGSITLDIAELVAPGEVIGIEMDEGQLQIARANTEKRGLTNVSFDPALLNLVTTQGWTTREELDEMIAWVQDWGERSDAFMAVMYCAVLGWNK